MVPDAVQESDRLIGLETPIAEKSKPVAVYK
jgi:hypothetical protein